jgi:hypothetical protein
MIFNPRDWYWDVSDHAGVHYSSARNIYVDDTDANYTAWLAADSTNAAIPVLSEAELWPTLAARSLLPDWMFDGTTFSQSAVGVYTQTQLLAYSASVRYGCEIQGVTSAGDPIRTDRVSRTAANQTLVYINANPTLTVNWKTLTGFTTLNQAAIVQFTTDINTHVQNCFNTEVTVSGDITAGTTTTPAQIDAAYQGIRAKAPKELKGKTKIEI